MLGVSGVPQDAIISIRAGASRRQAPVSSLGQGGTPLKFAGGPAGVNPFKLDVLQPIGSTRLALKPNGGTFSVPIKGAEGVTVNLAVREALSNDQDLFDRIDANKDGVITRREFNEALRAEGDKPVLQPIDGGKPLPIVSGKILPALPKAEDPRFPAAANAAKEYLESHKLLPFVRALLQTVVRERPDDPYNFIAEQFRNAGLSPEELSRTTTGSMEAKTTQVNSLKEKAKGALVSALFDEDATEDDASPQDIDEAKVRARTALHAALLGGGEAEDDEAKAKARDTVAAELGLGGDDVALVGPAGEEVEEAKAMARDALAKALVSEASGPSSQESLETDELGKAEKKKSQLEATKQEMGKMNFALKSEISELNDLLKNLEEQRNSLRMKMNALG